MDIPTSDTARGGMTVKLVLGILANAAIFGAAFFIPAGTLNWWRAWVIVGFLVVGSWLTSAYLYRVNPAVIEQRFKSPIQKGQPLADKVVVSVLLAAFVAVLLLIPLDVFRWHIFARPGLVVSSLGLVLFATGWWVITLSMRENAFATPAVRHIEEKEQRVVSSGVYGHVRHPMYAGFTPWMIGLALWLESYTAGIMVIATMSVLVVRILLEEQFLKRELPGYAAYMKRVRYRLVPGVW